MNRHIKPRGDDGASLLIVLVIITTVALVMGATLGEVGTSLNSSVALRDQAGSAYNGDGAAQVAINDLRTGYGYPSPSAFNNASNTTCFGPNTTSTTLNLQDFYPGTGGQSGAASSSASTTCTAEPGTGAQGPLVQITDANKPGNAILTLGQNPAEDGFNIKALAKNSKGVLVPFNVHGGIVSDSNINVASGSLISNTSVYAHTGCTGIIVSTPVPVCNKPVVNDPGYPSDPQAANPASPVVPPYRTVPTSCPGGLVTFLPGYYDNAAALSNLMDGTGTCKNSVWWFTPGSYYFDFHNVENPIGSLSKAGGDIWLIKNGQLIAGTPCASRTFPDPINDPNNPKCSEIAKPSVPAVVPGACEFPTETQNSSAGVQFIFGGDSQLQIAGGDAEICGSYQTNRPPLAFYGQRTGTASTSTQSGLALTSVPTQGSFNPTATAANLVSANDGKIASWKSTSKNDTTTLSVSGYTPSSGIPAGSTFRSATISVRHRHSDAPSNDTLTAVLTPAGAPAEPAASVTGGAGSSAYQTDTMVVDALRTGSLAEAIHSGTFTGAKIDLTADLPAKADTEDIDSITLAVAYDPPAFRAETNANVPANCLAATYTGVGSGSCAVLSTSTSYAGAFYMQGTTYTPIAPVDITLSNVTQQVLRFGLIARTLFVKETGSLTYGGPVIVLPDNSVGYGTDGTIVDLKVYVCEGISTPQCSTLSSKKLMMTARVLVFDPTGSPVAGARQMKILSWSQQR